MSPSNVSNPIDDRSGFYGWTNTLKGVYYGPGSLATALPNLLDTLEVKKVLVITGHSLYEKANVYGATFYEIGEHTPIAGIRKGMDLFKEHTCDAIVAVGGGSPIDGSKAILYSIQLERGSPTPKQIAIPTTLSAAEYSIGAGFTDEAGNKVAVSSQDLAPSGVILDAELTLATPERLWLSTGIRALDHAVESLYRPGVPYPIKQLCYGAIADLFHYLPISKEKPQDVHTRQHLQLASWMSLWPLRMQKYSALGISHSLGHKLGARYKIPHGITSCMTLSPAVLLKADIGSDNDKKVLANALFHLRETSTGSLDDDVRKLSSLIQKLVVNLGLKSRLSEYKVPQEALISVAEAANGSQNQEYEVSRIVKLLESIM